MGTEYEHETKKGLKNNKKEKKSKRKQKRNQKCFPLEDDDHLVYPNQFTHTYTKPT